MRLSLASAALLATLSTPSLAAIDVQFAPGADAKPYRKVLIAPAQVEFQREFLAEAKSSRNPTQRLRPEEVRQLALDMGESFSGALAEAFKKRGFEIAPAPAGDVLRISPALKNLYVNAPDAQTAGMSRSYVREAGGAMMVAEASNPAGVRVASASDESTTTRTLGFEPANRVTNLFRFEAMFRAWADEFADAIAGRK
jgi:hypothetical protein